MPDIITKCPSCLQDITKEELVTNIKYKNENAIVIYECPHCNENYKVNMYQYNKWKQGGIEIIDSYKEFDKTPGDKAADLGLLPYILIIGIIIFVLMT